jgi:ligand-binding sensor domain-containing protein/signal transduction histidine kinase
MLCSAVPPPLYGQSIAARSYSSELANSTVYTIVQDHRGFLWFGTAAGVTRFDGVSSQHYGIADGLENEYVTTLTQYRDSIVFAGTWGNGVYYFTNGRFSRYTAFEKFLPRKIKFLMADKSNRLWVGDARNLGYIQNNRYTVLDLKLRLPGIIYAICERKNGDILLGTSQGLYCISAGVLRRMCNVPEMDTPLYSITEGPDGRIWCASDGTLYEVRDTLIRIHRDVLPGKERIMVVKCTSNNSLWLAGIRSGIFVYTREKLQTFSTFRQLVKNQINTMYEDTEQNLWIGTYGLGAVMTGGIQNMSYTTDDGLPNNYVTAICGNGSDSVIIGTRDGAAIISGYTLQHITVPSIGDLPFAYISSIAYDTAGQFWLIAGTNVLHYKKNGRVQVYSPGGMSKLLYADRFGTMWIYRQALDSNQLRYEQQGELLAWNKIPALEKLRIRSLTHDHTGTFWIGTDSGAFSWQNGVLHHYTTSNGLPSNTVQDIEENRDGIWFATNWGLANLYNGRWKYYTSKNGLSSNRCYYLLVDKSGTLWIGTQHGLNRFVDGSFIVYDKQDGLISDEVHSLYMSNDGVLWVGTNNGVTRLYTRTAENFRSSLPLYITHASASGIPIGNNDMLPHDRNNVQFEFVGITYRYPDNIMYRYRIEDIDREWQEATQRSVNYSSLPAGHYIFQVQARDKSGTWGNIVSFSFSIRPAFWETWWFQSIGIAGTGLLLVLIARWQINRRRKKELEQLALQYRILQLEQKALQALMNPHFIFNALNSIHRYIRTHDEEQAGEYLAKFAKLIRITFESIQNTFVVLEEEVQRLELYLSLEQLRFGNRLTYTIHVDSAVDGADIRVPSMILQPYVENAILHGIMSLDKGGHITVDIRQKDEELILTVDDNGIGIETARSNKKNSDGGRRSSGMLLTEERLRLLSRLAGMNIVLTISEKPEDFHGRRGTTVEIVLPVDLADTID